MDGLIIELIKNFHNIRNLNNGKWNDISKHVGNVQVYSDQGWLHIDGLDEQKLKTLDLIYLKNDDNAILATVQKIMGRIYIKSDIVINTTMRITTFKVSISSMWRKIIPLCYELPQGHIIRKLFKEAKGTIGHPGSGKTELIVEQATS